jgi:hypothetical protein
MVQAAGVLQLGRPACAGPGAQSGAKGERSSATPRRCASGDGKYWKVLLAVDTGKENETQDDTRSDHESLDEGGSCRSRSGWRC